MPSVSVPLHGAEGWQKLMTQRKQFWLKPGNDSLSAHFRASEFYCHDGSPCPIVSRPGLIKLCVTFLEPLRAKFGPCLILSGYRHELYNASIGGARMSQHIYEHNFESVAADLRFQRGGPSLWAAEAKRIRTSRNKGNGGIGIYVRSNFIHCDTRDYKADWTG